VTSLAPAKRRGHIEVELSEAPTGNVTEIRLLMHLRGYRPLRIKNGYKQPFDKDWPVNARRNPPLCVIEPLSFEHLSTGMMCDGLRIVDIDIEDQARADQVVTLAEDMLGSAPMRYRANSHRAALLYRAADGEPRKASIIGRELKTEDQAQVQPDKVEILGYGQQLHVDGLHPSGELLQWDGGSPWESDRADLASVTEDQVMAFLVEAAKIIGCADAPDITRERTRTLGSKELPQFVTEDHPENVARFIRWLKTEAKVSIENEGGNTVLTATLAMGSSYALSEDVTRECLIISGGMIVASVPGRQRK
jgi:hypothetical protein